MLKQYLRPWYTQHSDSEVLSDPKELATDLVISSWDLCG